MTAILSDIHANLEALTAVLADIERQGVTRVYNLGDTLGYGPNPVECLDLAMRMSVVLMGNFEYAVLTGTDGFGVFAERSVLWSRDQLTTVGLPDEKARRSDFLRELPQSHRESHQGGETLFVHGSPRNLLHEGVFSEDIYNARKMGRIRPLFDRLCFCGHTHHPGIFSETTPGQWEHFDANECDGGLLTTGRKLICNVGSVGQPRDLDNRACYVLFDGEKIWFRRVEYDIEVVVRKIHAVPELADFLGDRLREGR